LRSSVISRDWAELGLKAISVTPWDIYEPTLWVSAYDEAYVTEFGQYLVQAEDEGVSSPTKSQTTGRRQGQRTIYSDIQIVPQVPGLGHEGAVKCYPLQALRERKK
jgi:hypothetical protein